METETKKTETKGRLTHGEVHICLTCEHHGTCRFAGALEGIPRWANRGGGYEVVIPGLDHYNGTEAEIATYPVEYTACPVGDIPILGGIRICPRHSSGDPKFTEGIISGDR